MISVRLYPFPTLLPYYHLTIVLGLCLGPCLQSKSKSVNGSERQYTLSSHYDNVASSLLVGIFKDIFKDISEVCVTSRFFVNPTCTRVFLTFSVPGGRLLVGTDLKFRMNT